MIEITNVGVTPGKMSFDGRDISDSPVGVVCIIEYKENDEIKLLQLPEPDMNNFIPIQEVDNTKLMEWLEAHK
jgi:hypothetical protein